MTCAVSRPRRPSRIQLPAHRDVVAQALAGLAAHPDERVLEKHRAGVAVVKDVAGQGFRKAHRQTPVGLAPAAQRIGAAEHRVQPEFAEAAIGIKGRGGRRGQVPPRPPHRIRPRLCLQVAAKREITRTPLPRCRGRGWLGTRAQGGQQPSRQAQGDSGVWKLHGQVRVRAASGTTWQLKAGTVRQRPPRRTDMPNLGCPTVTETLLFQ